MVTLVNRLDRVAILRETWLRNEEALIKAASLDCAFTYRESAMEVNTVQDRLADFLQTPAHLEVVRNFSQLWRPYRKVLDGELLMRFIYKGYFPKEYLEFAREKSNAA